MRHFFDRYRRMVPKAATTTVTLTSRDTYVRITNGTYTITLPSTAEAEGLVFVLHQPGTGALLVTVTDAGDDPLFLDTTINAANPLLVLACRGGAWMKLSSNRNEGAGETAVKTADYTVLARESGKTFTNEGASGTVVFTLPPAVLGLEYTFVVMAAQAIRIDPDGTETISDPDDAAAAQGTAGQYATADAAGEFVHIRCVKAGQWNALAYRGTWALG